MSRRQRRTYSKEFKQQIVDLYLAGKPRAEIIREYELTPSSFDKWMKQAQSFNYAASPEVSDPRSLSRIRFANLCCRIWIGVSYANVPCKRR